MMKTFMNSIKKGTGWSDNDTSPRDKREYEAAVRKLGQSYLEGKKQKEKAVEQFNSDTSNKPESISSKQTEGGIAKTIKKEGNKYILYSKDGSKKLGEFTSEEQAKAREKQVEYFKYINKAFNLDQNVSD